MRKSTLPPPPEPRVTPLSLKVRKSTAAALVKAAKTTGRTKSSLAEAIIEEWLRAEGFLK